MKEKIMTGTNDRPKDETIAQTGEGLPDESANIIEVDEDGVAQVRAKLAETATSKPDDFRTSPEIPDEVDHSESSNDE
ncbi:MAG: hypothetical protein ACT6QU_12710 [Aliihoeflea sp.]|uniref:hypothetical protein n=1 Tax=Aliihoeflea sp. TaxID=2608088 RepID=UPI004037E48B